MSGTSRILSSDTIVSDTTLTYPFSSGEYGGLYMNLPSNFQKTIVFDEETNQYILYQKIGNTDLFIQKVMSFEEYLDYQLEEMMTRNWDLSTM